MFLWRGKLRIIAPFKAPKQFFIYKKSLTVKRQLSKNAIFIADIYSNFFLIFFTRYNKFLIETDLCLHIILGIRLSIIFFFDRLLHKLEVLFYGKLYVAMVRQLGCKFLTYIVYTRNFGDNRDYNVFPKGSITQCRLIILRRGA